MSSIRTLFVFLSLLATLASIASPGLVWPAYLDSPVGLMVTVPYLSVYLFHSIGIPGLLQNNGACGWGWCTPTTFGWVFLSLVWATVAWLIAWLIAATTRRRM